MVDAWQESEEPVETGARRKGYMGHVTKICNSIVTATEKGPHSSLINSLLQGESKRGHSLC